MRKFTLKPYKDWKIFKKLYLQFIVITLAAAGSIGLVSFYVASNSVRESTKRQAAEIVSQIAGNLEYRLYSYEKLVENIAYNNELQALLRTGRSSIKKNIEIQNLVESILIINYDQRGVAEIEIYGASGGVYNVPFGDSRTPTVDKQTYIREAAAGGGKSRWINETNRSGNLELVKEIRDLTTLRNLGAIRLSVTADYLKSVFGRVDFAANGQIFVMQDQEVLISAANDTLLGNLVPAIANMESGTKEVDVPQMGRSLLIRSRLDAYNIAVYGVIPLKEVYREVETLKEKILLCALAVLAFAMILAKKMTHIVVNPILNMIEPMKAAARGDFSYPLHVNSEDEIGQLRAGYNAMTQKIDALIKDVYQSELLKKEAEFQALQAQINPHFLYNTLDTINWMAKQNGVMEISHMIIAISNLMRISISNTKNIITIEEEIKYIKDYLYIQQTRYQNKVSTEIDIFQELLPLYIPKLILQPLVENAITHGLENKKGSGNVRIVGRNREGTITIQISDDGIGISPDRLNMLLRPDKPQAMRGHTGLGLQTVQKRIQYVFGMEYGLTIQSEVGIGTTVTVRFPADQCNADLIGRFPGKRKV